MHESTSLTPMNPLVHITIGTHVNQENLLQSIVVHERSFIGELQLDSDPDNTALLIAVGDMLGVKQPLSACRISCLGKLIILWLDHNRWLILRSPDEHTSLEQLLVQMWGQDITLGEHDKKLTARLSEAALIHLLNSSNTQEFRTDSTDYRQASLEHLQQGEIQIQSVESADNYEILVRKSCADALLKCLNVS
ncbi:sarcosine oxidase subunit gamma family protein [Neptunomonas japonica]|uniref:Sarcosine oxidase, subunit gamma n=1 Tax=Neptunomonas japonica JAMM 1380 TaxID=1441457 RepID=A0A7R6PJ84_9GAMM|nr:sarcosine oxidase subunit gamma family protein [Neptunomonas japonica]BBB30608.1 sarcosine oxidase, subunit gamma [Neptunomonas japonica JAMM 1380]